MIVLKDHTVYVVTMYRYASREAHSYVVAVTDNLKLAIKAEEDESEYRGGKYTGEIVRMKINGDRRERTTVPHKKIWNE